MTMGERIRARREQLGYNADYLGKLVGKNRATIYRYENGDVTTIPADVVADLASVLHVPVQYLYGVEDDSEWSLRFCDTLAAILANADHEDITAAGIDLASLERVVKGETALTLDLACSICDQLGETLDTMLGRDPIESIKAAIGDDGDLGAQIIDAILHLSESSKLKALGYLQALQANEQK